MKTRIKVLTTDSYEEVLRNAGYSRKKESVYSKEGLTYKISWLHLNSWGQLTYIDLIELKNV